MTLIPINDRIGLTEVRPTDAASLVRHLNDCDIYKHTLRIPFPYGAADAERFLGIVEQTTNEHGHPVHFAIRERQGELIGGCGFDDLRYGHRAEIGYWLARPFWGQGIMTAVVRALLKVASHDWKLVRVTAHVFESNATSARVLEKNGFQLEGRLRKQFKKDGQFIDSRLYAWVREVAGNGGLRAESGGRRAEY